MGDNTQFFLLFNAFVLGCFTVLAIVLGKWWVVLFAVIFVFYRKPEFLNKEDDDDEEDPDAV